MKKKKFNNDIILNLLVIKKNTISKIKCKNPSIFFWIIKIKCNEKKKVIIKYK